MADVSEPTVQFDIFAEAPPRSDDVKNAVLALADAPPSERGAVHTRPAVAAFVLDLVDYQASRPLHTLRLLEPSAGDGVFLLDAVRRLLTSWTNAGRLGGTASLRPAITAVEVHRATAEATRARLVDLLAEYSISASDAADLAESWLVCDDFLLASIEGPFDAVVGNPPYLRHDAIPAALARRYRRDYSTVYDRADLYVPFIQRGVDLLGEGGRLAYICADRWMKNKFGGPLRQFLASRVTLRHVVRMHGADAFDDAVDAYPSVFTVERGPSATPTQVASLSHVGDIHLDRLAREIADGATPTLDGVMSGDDPWLLQDAAALATLRSLEASLPTLAEARCHVGIGVATGADRVFIASVRDLDIEPDRVLPLAVARDVQTDGSVEWSGKALANPFDEQGRLVDLKLYPKLAAYFEGHGDALRKRYVAKKSPTRWYKTIDKVSPHLAATPKLLIPDIKGQAAVGYDEGSLYPHHNLYYVTSREWDLRALQAVLRSRIAEFQVGAYAVRMRGGYLRFQAQYLRRIRIPQWETVSPTLRDQLADASHGTRDDCDAAARRLYGIGDDRWHHVLGAVS